eukprot:GSMAST32.ASY1.ANO1.1510.1 assembled CDS
MRRFTSELGRCLRETGQALDRVGMRAQNNERFREQFSRHRKIMGIFDKTPDIANDCWIAPSASIVGEVDICTQSSVWYNCVLRGDVNEISIGGCTNIQDGTVINVSKSNPLGFPASTFIGHMVSIGPGCSLSSCTIEDNVVIGSGSIICDGALVEKNSILSPGTVLNAGHRIPSGQLWEGNPATYVRDLTGDEIEGIEKQAEAAKNLGAEHKHEFLPFGTAHLEAEKLEKQ